MSRLSSLLIALLLASLIPANAEFFFAIKRGVHSGTPGHRRDLVDARRAELWPFEPSYIEVEASVKEKMADTRISMQAESDVGRVALVTMRIPENAFVNHLEMTIGGIVYEGSVKLRDDARQKFNDAVAAGDSASLVETHGSSFSISFGIEAGETALITVGYQQYLTLKNGVYDYNLALDTAYPSGVLPRVSVSINIGDSDGLESISVLKPEVKCAFGSTSGGNNFRTCNKYGDDEKDPRAYIRFFTWEV